MDNNHVLNGRDLFSGQKQPDPPPARTGHAVGSPAEPTTSDADKIHHVDPAHVLPGPGQRTVDMDRVLKELVPSFEQPHGQIVPGLCYRDPPAALAAGVPEALFCIDGMHRKGACQYLAMPFKTVILDHVPTRSEVRRRRVAIAMKYDPLDNIELGAELFAEKQETNCGLDALAAGFDITRGWACKLLAPYERGAPELLDAMKSGDVVLTAAPAVASLPEEKQRPLIQRLAEIRAADAKRRPAKRDTVERMVRELKDKKDPRDRRQTVKQDGVSLTFPSGMTSEKLGEITKKLLKNIA